MGPTRITFSKSNEKGRFVISDEQKTNNANMQGSWSLCDGKMNYQLLLTFDAKRPKYEEFDWVEGYNWPDGREPRSRWKASDMNGYCIWEAKPEGSSGDGTDMGEARIRGDELRLGSMIDEPGLDRSELKPLNSVQYEAPKGPDFSADFVK